ARNPTKHLWFRAKLLNEIMNLEIYRDSRLTFACVGRRPRDMHNAMVFVDRRNAQLPTPHVLHSQRSIAIIPFRHDLLELFVVLSGGYSRRCGRYELASIERCNVIHVSVAAQRISENSLITCKAFSHARFHYLILILISPSTSR